MVTIGISGSYGGLNAGDEAILTALLASLRERRPDAEFVVFSRDADHTRRHQEADRVVQTRDVSRDAVIPEIERLDLFVLGGGGLLYDGEARHYLRDVQLAQDRGIPTATFAVGAGPLRSSDERGVVADALGRMQVVTVRDEVSKRVLEEVGVDRPIEVTADPALLLTPEPVGDELIRQEGADGATPLVGMSVREPGNAAPHLDEHGYHQLLAHAADFVVDRFGAQVIFVPTERGDVRHAHAVVGHMLAADRAEVMKRVHRPRELLGVIAAVDFVIAMRLHTLIFAAIAGVPFLPLPYAPKVADFVTSLGVALPPPIRRESAGTLLATLDKVWDLRHEQRDAIAPRLAALQQRARRTATLTAELLDRRPPTPLAS